MKENGVREIRVEVELDKPRVLRYDRKAVSLLQKEKEMLIQRYGEIPEAPPGREEVLRVAQITIWSGLQYEEEPISLKQVGEIIYTLEPTQLFDILHKANKAIEAACYSGNS